MARSFILEIQMDNDVFVGAGKAEFEVARILHRLAESIYGSDRMDWVLFDVNGNRVGQSAVAVSDGS